MSTNDNTQNSNFVMVIAVFIAFLGGVFGSQMFGDLSLSGMAIGEGDNVRRSLKKKSRISPAR